MARELAEKKRAALNRLKRFLRCSRRSSARQSAIDELVTALKFSPALTGPDACRPGTTAEEAADTATT